ncbi:MAG: cell division protein WhiA [Gaiellaceae bacterium]|nr:cell division protein WhiA [Gaiellaceae bacterium]
MSLSEDLRHELAAITPRSSCDRLAELSGLFHSAGSEHLKGRGEVAVHLDVVDPAVARRAFSLLRAFGVASEIRTYRRRAFDGGTRYQLHVAGDDRALQVLNEAGVVSSRLTPLEHPPRRVVASACCRAAYVRGALLGGGSLSGPRAPHLEIRSAGTDGADFLASVAAEEGMRLGVLDRGRHAVAYAKGLETIADILALAGASETVLLFQERAVMAGTRARANRLANADHANLVRTSRAAHEQLRAVEFLRCNGRLAKLSAQLQEVAELRTRHPTLPLRELALKCRPPTTKAAVHRRLRKLQDLAST